MLQHTLSVRRKFIAYLILYSLLVGSSYCIYYVLNKVYFTKITVYERQHLFVDRGQSLSDVANHLQEISDFDSSFIFIIYAKLMNAAKSIKPGEYDISNGLTMENILNKIVKQDSVRHRFTIIEGWNQDSLMGKININLASLPQHYINNTAIESIPILNGSSEGLFYPDTYFFNYPDNHYNVLQRANRKMLVVLKDEFENKSNLATYNNMYEGLIVASLIEKETAIVSEKPLIAGIIMQRLKLKMKLQIDASVRYGVKNFRYGLKQSELKKDTPFNTYIHYGLPPTPIAIPSLSSIHAAFHPVKTSYLYYVAKEDGTHQFSKNLREHRSAIKKYLRK